MTASDFFPRSCFLGSLFFYYECHGRAKNSEDSQANMVGFGLKALRSLGIWVRQGAVGVLRIAENWGEKNACFFASCFLGCWCQVVNRVDICQSVTIHYSDDPRDSKYWEKRAHRNIAPSHQTPQPKSPRPGLSLGAPFEDPCSL